MTHNGVKNGSSREGLYRLLPSVNDLLLTDGVAALIESSTHGAVVHATRTALERVRKEISSGDHTQQSILECVAGLPDAIGQLVHTDFQYSLRRVINATGVILHTNLGRAPLSKPALKHLVRIARGYSNLELDLDSGERGTRDVHVENLILGLIATETGAAAQMDKYRAIVVNNCAAATFLALQTLVNGKEVIVSRGELVEIGGGFRIPEILEQSGAVLKEVGTTNRTRLADYEIALTPNTGLILRVHQSNFSMEGFVERPRCEELVALGKRFGIPIFEDQGTGLLHTLANYGIEGEATLFDSIKVGCDLVCASGDKLLGGPQCGILIGKTELVEKIRRNPLFRTYRVDKLVYAALEGTLVQYLSGSQELIPIVRMIRLTPLEIKDRCEQIAASLSACGFGVEVVPVESLIGGGTAPKAKLPSYAISIKIASLGAAEVLRNLRSLDTPIIGRVSEDRVLLDLRTVDTESDRDLIDALSHLSGVEQPRVAAPGR